MISVLVYGRNDTHGYNLHRRAALSLNCIAEVLTDADDEIIFVDYNTPDELPTFIEALADTLTDACLDLLRVLRVPCAIHEERFASRTHLPAIEPVARNAAARRSSPSNRWLLSTNTDMIFVPLADRSLSEICEQLADGFYGLPRFELPEWLWETLPRSDPHRAMAEIRRWGPRLCLDEPTLSYDWIRFDAPGDFQLILRDDFFAIHGCDEEMLLGYHVDSNLSRRMLSLRRDAIETVGDDVAAYHCNHHLRIPTVYHGPRVISNDIDRFVFSIEQPELIQQRGSWGLNGTELEEVPLGRPGRELAKTVAWANGDDPGRRGISDAKDARDVLTYDSAHVLPFAADSLALLPPKTTVAYFGVNPVLERMLTALVTGLGGERQFVVAQLDEDKSLAALDQAADLFVVDLGVDRSLLDDELDGSARLPAGLGLVYEAFERLVELERTRTRTGVHPRRFVLLNSRNMLWDAYVLAQLDCTYETTHSRVRLATVKDSPVNGDRTSEDIERARRLIRWRARPSGHLVLRPKESVSVATLDQHSGFGDGWADPDEWGIWTQGPRASLAVALDGVFDDPTLVLSIGNVCVGPDDSLETELLLNGEHVSTRSFAEPERQCIWQFALPAEALGSRTADVTLVLNDPRSPSTVGWSRDDRLLGLHLRAVTFGSVPHERSVIGYLRAKIGFRRHLNRLRTGQR